MAEYLVKDVKKKKKTKTGNKTQNLKRPKNKQLT